MTSLKVVLMTQGGAAGMAMLAIQPIAIEPSAPKRPPERRIRKYRPLRSHREKHHYQMVNS